VDCTPLRYGGGVQVAIAFLSGLVGQSEFEWHAVAPQQMREALRPLQLDAGKLTFVSKTSPADIFKIRKGLRALEAQQQPDVVFTVFGPSYHNFSAPHVVGFALPNLLYPRFRPLGIRRRLTTGIFDILRRRSFRRADRLVVETATAAELLAKRVGVHPSKIEVVGNSVNPRLLQLAVLPLSSEGPFRILVPSAYYPHKNLEIIPDVAEYIAGIDPELDFQFFLTLGEESEGWSIIRGKAKQKAVEDKITNLGNLNLDALGAQYNQASCVFLPTLREISTAVYPEAFYFRRLLITSDTDFARDLCGDAAVFVNPRDPKEIAETIAVVLKDPNRMKLNIEEGQRQLARKFPSPHEKFEAQLSILRSVVQ